MRGDDPARSVPIETWVQALEGILVEKGYVQPASLDTIVETYEHGSVASVEGKIRAG